MPDREKVINGLESLRDICNARSNLFVGDSRIIWAGYGKLASDAIDIIESQERIYLALEKDWKELRNRITEQEAEIRQLRLALDIAKGTCKGIKSGGGQFTDTPTMQSAT